MTTKHKNLKRNLAVISLAILCCFLVTTAQPVNSILPIVIYGLVLGISLIAEYLYLNYWFSQNAPEEGATLETYLALYYNKVLDSFTAINGELANMAEVFPTTKYFFARKAETTAMTYVNESTFPTWKVLNGSGIYSQLVNITDAYFKGTNAVFDGLSNETAYYFLNEFGDLKVVTDEGDQISGLTGIYAYHMACMQWCRWWVGGGGGNTGQGTNQSFQMISNSSYLIIELKNYQSGAITSYSNRINLTLTTTSGQNNPTTGNSSITHSWLMEKTTPLNQYIALVIPSGSWNVNMQMGDLANVAITGDYHIQDGAIFSTNALIYNISQATFTLPSRTAYNAGHEQTWATGDIFATFNGALAIQNVTRNLYFKNGASVIHSINVTLSNAKAFIESMNSILYVADQNAHTYHTTLRNLGYDEYSEIPPDYILAWVDGVLTINSNSNMTYVELLNLYYAYLQALANMFNSTNFETANWTTPTANWTWANILVNGTLYNSTNANITEGWLYFSMPNEEVTFNVGQNTTFTDPGWCFNTNTSRLYQYQAGYYVAVNNLTVNGIYGINGTITPYTIAIVVNPPSTPDEPHATGTGGGGGSSLGIFLLIIVAALILLSRGKSSSDNPVNIIMPKSKAAKPRSGPYFQNQSIPFFFLFFNQ